MKFINFASSSAGNAYYLALDRKNDKPIAILLEAGLNYRDLITKLMQHQLTLNDIDLVLVTHAHKDHSRAVPELLARGKKVYSNELVANSGETTLRHNERRAIASETKVIPLRVEHDAEETFAFILQTDMETVLFATDFKYIKTDISSIKFDYVFIEANYDDMIIHHAIKNADMDNDHSNLSRYKRLLNSHMSISNCIKHLKKMDLSNCKGIFLIHLSDRHANEIKFKNMVKRATGVECWVCKKHGGFI